MIRIKFVFAAILFILYVQIATAAVLQVPQNYPTIRTAVQAAASGDTILISPGAYSDSLTMPVDLTFASNFIFSNDTTLIEQTIWHSIYGRASINPSGFPVTLRGIRFESIEPPPLNCEVLQGPTPSLIVDHCVFSGTFDPEYSLSHAALNPSTGGGAMHPDITLTNSRFYGSDNSSSPWLNCQGANQVFIDNCTVTGRSNSSLLVIELAALNTVTIRRSSFYSLGRGIRAYSSASVIIDSCAFIGMNHIACSIGSQNAPSFLSNCIFDSCVAPPLPIDPSYSLISFVQHYSIESVIRNTIFRRISILNAGLNNNVVHIQNGSIRVSNCEITQNNAITPFFFNESDPNRIEAISIDSSRIHDNQNVSVLLGSGLRLQLSTVTNSDFDRNGIQYLSNGFDSVMAPNNWWGDVSGPQWIGNPNGRGQILLANANPVPWRTTPVFPNTAIREPSDPAIPSSAVLFAPYPNPFNSSITIPFASPPDSKSSVTIYDIAGRLIERFSIPATSTRNRIEWKPQHLASNVYFVRLQTQTGISQTIPIQYIR